MYICITWEEEIIIVFYGFYELADLGELVLYVICIPIYIFVAHKTVVVDAPKGQNALSQAISNLLVLHNLAKSSLK